MQGGEIPGSSEFRIFTHDSSYEFALVMKDPQLLIASKDCHLYITNLAIQYIYNLDPLLNVPEELYTQLKAEKFRFLTSTCIVPCISEALKIKARDTKYTEGSIVLKSLLDRNATLEDHIVAIYDELGVKADYNDDDDLINNIILKKMDDTLVVKFFYRHLDENRRFMKNFIVCLTYFLESVLNFEPVDNNYDILKTHIDELFKYIDLLKESTSQIGNISRHEQIMTSPIIGDTRISLN